MNKFVRNGLLYCQHPPTRPVAPRFLGLGEGVRMRWKITTKSPTHGEQYNWSLGYPTRKSAASAAKRLNATSSPYPFRVEKMTPEDEALASELERNQ